MRALKRRRPLLGLLHCMALLACGGEAVDTPAAGADTRAEAAASPLRLDLASRTLLHPIQVAAPERQKFVQVEIERIVNPRLIRIVFELRYRPQAGAEELLGSFAPFPPDNAGTYIVATRGLLHTGGSIVLSMVPLDEIGPGDQLQVDLKAIMFRTE
jgi:hypothetical protein